MSHHRLGQESSPRPLSRGDCLLPQSRPPPWFFNSGETLVKCCWHPCWLPASLPSADVSTGAVSLYGSAELCGHCWGSKEGLFSSR